MKRFFCCSLFLLSAIIDTAAQKNIFFKKDKPKNILTAKKPVSEKNDRQQVSSRMSLYTISSPVSRRYSFSLPKEYESTGSKDALLFIIGLGSSIAGSIYADKMHYNYSGRLFNSPHNYWRNWNYDWRNIH